VCLGVYNIPRHIQLIRTNYRLLSEKMDVNSGLLTELYSKEVISNREKETIKAGKTFYDSNEELLEVMKRKTEVQFQQFVAALRAYDMTELADALEIQS